MPAGSQQGDPKPTRGFTRHLTRPRIYFELDPENQPSGEGCMRYPTRVWVYETPLDRRVYKGTHNLRVTTDPANRGSFTARSTIPEGLKERHPQPKVRVVLLKTTVAF